jgi:hypothetical protein
MALQVDKLDGSERKIKRKPWRELKQSELVERIYSLPKDEVIETSMTAYDPTILLALTQVKFSLYGGRRKGQSAILNGNVHKGADMISHTLKDEIHVLSEAGAKLYNHPVADVREEVLREVLYLDFKHSIKKKLWVQEWVPESLSYVAECLNIATVGLYSIALCYALYEEEIVSEDYKEILLTHVKHFRVKVEGRAYKLAILLNHIKNEESNTRV